LSIYLRKQLVMLA